MHRFQKLIYAVALVLVVSALSGVRGQQQYVDDNGERDADRRIDEGVTESEYEYYEDSDSTTTTTTTTTTPRPRILNFRQRTSLYNRKATATQSHDESSDARKSRPAFPATSRNAINDQDRAESRTQEKIVEDDGSYFSRRYARFLFRQRSG